MDVPRKIQVILFTLRIRPIFREKAEKAVGIFAGFRYKISGFPDPDIATEWIRDAADGQCGVCMSARSRI